MAEDIPTFSIIIPTHRRPQQLTACLAAIQKIDYPRSLFEVVIVDDGATTDRGLIAPFEREIEIRWHAQPKTGPAGARNKGAILGRGEFLAFLDDDCLPGRDWLKALAAGFGDDPNTLLGGKIINALPDNVFSSASQLLVDFLYLHFSRNDSKIQFFTSNNIAIRKLNFEKLRGFEASFPLPAAEDRDFCWRWRERQGPLGFVEQAEVFHAHHLTWRAFCRQHFNYGRGAFHFHRRRKSTEQDRIRLEPLSFYRNLLLFPFKQLGLRKGLFTALLFGVTQIATGLGFFYQKFTD
jgi:GT2 family glycosyltransferase